MLKRHKYDIIVILALIAFGVSLYLSITHYFGFAVPCGLTHGCESVLSSRYAIIFGIPTSVLGLIYFTAVIISSLLANHYRVWQKLLTILLSIGGIMALGFLSIQFFILKKVCQYCLTTDTISILLLLWDLNVNYSDQRTH